MRQETGPENHQAGSCKMGPASDPMAVVDPLLRVHGIKGLRVADTSIMPQVFIFLFLLFYLSLVMNIAWSLSNVFRFER